MLEAVDALVELLELENKLLAEGREPPAALLERIELANGGIGAVAERMRREPPPTPGPEARALKTRLEQRFVHAFRLTRDNEQRLRGGASTATAAARPAAAGRPGSPREVEQRYRMRMRRSAGRAGVREDGA